MLQGSFAGEEREQFLHFAEIARDVAFLRGATDEVAARCARSEPDPGALVRAVVGLSASSL